MPKNYTKPPITISEQIFMLKKRGLVVSDISLAEKVLAEVSYFRFAAYLRPMENNKLTHEFKPDSTFENAVKLYNFDSELRKIILNAIQHIEVAVRAKMIHHFSIEYGPFWFMNGSLFRDKDKYADNFNCVIREIKRSKEDFIVEHYRRYDSPPYPPSWKTIELCSFGTLSKLYYNFSDNRVKKKIAREFNLPNHVVMESWLRSFTLLRNYCAHHARIWNRLFCAGPQMSVNLRGKWITNQDINANKLYALLCCLLYCLDSLCLGNADDFRNQLKILLLECTSIDINAMGFTKNWEQEPLWKVNGQQSTVNSHCPLPTIFLSSSCLLPTNFLFNKKSVGSQENHRLIKEDISVSGNNFFTDIHRIRDQSTILRHKSQIDVNRIANPIRRIA